MNPDFPARKSRRAASHGSTFLQPRDVPAALEFGGEPGFHDPERLILGDGALADGEAVGVVVGAAPDRGLFVPAEAAADAAHAVGDHGLAVARAAEDDAAFEFAAGHGPGHGIDIIGIVGGRGLVIGAEIMDRVPLGEKEGLDGLLVGEAGVVGTDGD